MLSGVAEHFNQHNHSFTDVSLLLQEAIKQRQESLRHARKQRLITGASTLTLIGLSFLRFGGRHPLPLYFRC